MGSAAFLIACALLAQAPSSQYSAVSSGRYFLLESETPIVIADDAEASIRDMAAAIAEAVGQPMPVLRDTEAPRRGSMILVGQAGRHRALDAALPGRQIRRLQSQKDGAYLLQIQRRRVLVAGKDAEGVFRGMTLLTQIAQSHMLSWPQLDILDWPSLSLRAVVTRGPLTTGELRSLAAWRCNAVIFDSDDFHTMNDAHTAVWRRVFDDARSMHIDPIPVFRVFSGAQRLLGAQPFAAEGRAITDLITFRGEEWAALSQPNVLATETHPIRVEISRGFPGTPGTDYEITPGLTEAPYAPMNAPWRIRRIAGGDILDGATVQVTYSYAPQDSSALCPYAVETAQLLRERLHALIETLAPKHIHIGGEAIARINQDLRSLDKARRAAEVFSDTAALCDRIVKEAQAGVRLMIWADAISPYQDAPRYGLGGGLPALPGDMVIGVRFNAAQNGAPAHGIQEMTAWAAQTGQSCFAVTDGPPALAYALARQAGAPQTPFLGVAVAAAVNTDVFQAGMHKAWSLDSPVLAWPECLNDYFHAAEWTPSEQEQIAIMAGHINRRSCEGQDPTAQRRDFSAALAAYRRILPKNDEALAAAERLFALGVAALTQTPLGTAPADGESPAASFQAAVVPYRPIVVPPEHRLLPIPAAPVWGGSAGRRELLFDLGGHAGPVVRLDAAVAASKLTLDCSDDDRTYAPLGVWTPDAGMKHCDPILLPQAPRAARYYRVIAEGSPLAAKTAGDARLFGLKGPAVTGCPYTPETPQLGPPLHAPVWQRAPQAAGFLSEARPAFAAAATEVYLCRSRTHLFVGVAAADASPEMMAAGFIARDAPLWMEESFELTLVPGEEAFPVRLLVNPLGTQYDSLGGDAGWQGAWEAAAIRHDAGWAALLSIPFETLGKRPERGEIWRVNFRRHQRSGITESSVWALDYNDPRRVQFGALRFD